jgi:hypothetical protein
MGYEFDPQVVCSVCGVVYSGSPYAGTYIIGRHSNLQRVGCPGSGTAGHVRADENWRPR